MSLRYCLIGTLALMLCGSTARAEAIIIDHKNTDITALSSQAIARAKAVLHIGYGHTSHGSQLTDGMSGLVGFANGGGLGLSYPANFFAWNNGGTGGALDLHDYAMGGDVGYYPAWVQNTSNYLENPANADVNVIIWSWCGQMDDKYAAGTLSNEYLIPMSNLEATYPDVVFVYMTGHVPDVGSMSASLDNRTKEACRVIKDYCTANNKVFYDFNDIEHYNPDGTYFEFATDNCDYYATNSGSPSGNWATEWQGTHTVDVDWYSCSSAHSQPLNANRKAYAAWALWCAIADDLDRDDISDPWEEEHGGTGMYSGGTNDCDGDGMCDYDEFVADTHPNQSTSHFDVAGVALTNSIAIEFASSTARVYSLMSCADLVTGSWSGVAGQTDVPGEADGTTTLIDTNDNACGLYRVGVSLP